MAETIYTDDAGHTYQAIGTMPYRELAEGSAYALPGDSRVYFASGRGAGSYTGLVARLAASVLERQVVALEQIG